jgi:hypothetical protein
MGRLGWKRRCRIVAMIALVVGIASAHAAFGQIEDISMWLEKTRFVPGEAIVVHFTAPAGFSPDAWIGLVPSGTPHDYEVIDDQYDFRADALDLRRLDGRSEGTLLMTAPGTPGIYDFRMYEGVLNGPEAGSMSFYVVAPGR